MKFPRNARLLRSTLDVAPFAVVFFLLIIFLALAAFLPTPGLSLRLPPASDLPGTDKPTVSVAIDAEGRLFFANQIVTTYGQLVHLTLLARDAGLRDVLLATLPRVTSEPGQP